MTVDKSKLQALAEKLLGEWYELGELRHEDRSGYTHGLHHDDDSFITTVTPAAILALIAENERLQGCEDVLRQLASYCGCGGYNAPEVDPEVFAKKIMDGINILNDPLMALADKRAAERDQLKVENEALRKALTAIANEIDCNTRPLIRDLVIRASGLSNGAHPNDLYGDCDRIDAIIDAAMRKGEQS